MKTRGFVPAIAENGRPYASPLEERMARVFQKEGIRYHYGVFFKVKGGSKEREVDFVLVTPIKPKLGNRAVRYVEIKKIVNSSALKQQEELKEVGIETFIVTEKMIEFYEDNGFVDDQERSFAGSD
jgi:hypothetical protein